MPFASAFDICLDSLHAYFWKCFKNSLGYLQSGLYSHPTVCCHITAVRTCSSYWWFALGFPFHGAINPVGIKRAVVGDLSLYCWKNYGVSCLSPVCVTAAVSAWMGLREPGVTAVRTAALKACKRQPQPAKWTSATCAMGPSSEVQSQRERARHLRVMDIPVSVYAFIISSKNDLKTFFYSLTMYVLIYFARE